MWSRLKSSPHRNRWFSFTGFINSSWSFKKCRYSWFNCPPCGLKLCSKPKMKLRNLKSWSCSHPVSNIRLDIIFLKNIHFFLLGKQWLAILHQPYDGYCDYYYFMVVLWRLLWLWRLPRFHQSLSDFFLSVDFRKWTRAGRRNQKSHPDGSCLQWKETLLKIVFALFFSTNFQLETKSETTTL